MTTLEPGTHTEIDERVHLRGVVWADYERLLAVRGESAVPRITYLDGEIELMNPATSHEWTKKMIARLLEAWADELAIELAAYGSWTIKNPERKRGLEPDECYILGRERKPRPDLALEVVVTSGGLNKLEVYRGLGVPEVWFWRRSAFSVHVLRGEQYASVAQSELLPALDLRLLARFVEHPSQSEAVREYRAVLRAMRRPQ
jgi:Uma2 family endonuclease